MARERRTPRLMPHPSRPGSMIAFAALPAFLILLTLVSVPLRIFPVGVARTPVEPRPSRARATIVATSGGLLVRNTSAPGGACVSEITMVIRSTRPGKPSAASRPGWKAGVPGFNESAEAWELRWGAVSIEADVCPGAEAGPFVTTGATGPALACWLRFRDGSELDVSAADFERTTDTAPQE
jgi:hypothetical protein